MNNVHALFLFPSFLKRSIIFNSSKVLFLVALVSVCKQDSSENFELILIKLFRGLEWGHVDNPFELGSYPPRSV